MNIWTISRWWSSTTVTTSTAGAEVLASDWSRVITWPRYWPLIGLCCDDYDPGVAPSHWAGCGHKAADPISILFCCQSSRLTPSSNSSDKVNIIVLQSSVWLCPLVPCLRPIQLLPVTELALCAPLIIRQPPDRFLWPHREIIFSPHTFPTSKEIYKGESKAENDQTKL